MNINIIKNSLFLLMLLPYWDFMQCIVRYAFIKYKKNPNRIENPESSQIRRNIGFSSEKLIPSWII